MADFQVTIVGLGVTGTSLGLALKNAVGQRALVVGHDKEPGAAAAARKAGAVDGTEWNLPNACRRADLVILALPLGAIRDTLAVIGQDLSPGCLVTDTAPVKAPVLAWARETLPPTVGFVGGDPIGGRGKPGGAAADRFAGTPYCLCPDAAAPPEAVERASDLALAVGAQPYFVDAAEHDGLVAMLDQVPFLVSAAVLLSAKGSPSWREVCKLGGGRFGQLLGALGDAPQAQLEAALANRENATRCLAALQAGLEELIAGLQGEAPPAGALAGRLAEARAEWERGDPNPPPPRPDYSPLGVQGLFWRKPKDRRK